MSEHTPGPWRNISGLISAECHENHGDDRDYCHIEIAGIIPGEEGISTQDMANARLIAAAPELNDSCSYLDYAAEGTGYEGADDDEIIEIRLTARALKDNRAAIAKARAQQPADDSEMPLGPVPARGARR